MKFFKNNKAITLVELIISITISSILFLIIFVFIANSIEELVQNDTKISTNEDFFDFKFKMKELIDSWYSDILTYTWSEDFAYTWSTNPSPNNVLYLKKTDLSGGVIIWIVNIDTKKIHNNYSYGDNFLWYRVLSWEEVIAMETDAYNNILSKNFSLDKIFKWLRIKDFRVDLYNWNIMDMYISVVNIFDESLFWQDFNDFFIDKMVTDEYNLVF